MFGKDIPLKIRGRKIKENSWKLAILRVCDLLGCWVKTWPFWKGWVKWPTQRLGIKSGHGLFESPGGGDFIDLFIFVPLKIGELFQIFQNWVIFQKVTAWISWYLDLPHTWKNWHGLLRPPPLTIPIRSEISRIWGDDEWWEKGSVNGVSWFP